MATSEDRSYELRKENILDLRSLSPMQQGMLYHALREPESPAYIEQSWWKIVGKLDVVLLEDAWNLLIARHDALRCVFLPAKAEEPLQVVLKERRVSLYSEDLRHLDATTQAAQISRYRLADRIAPFDLTRGPLQRVSLFLTGEQDTDLIWTHHHIILDGWSCAILIEELLHIYDSRGDHSMPAPARPETYCAWLKQRDLELGRRWWSTLLNGYQEPAPLPPDPLASGPGSLEVLTLNVGPQTTTALRVFAEACNVTLNTVVQTAWGLVLGQACNRNDVVFGMTVSGRPASLSDSERMVGLFINTVPVRVSFQEDETVASLAMKIQDQILGGEAYHHLPLAEIQDLSQPRSRLLDHLLTFENYPVGKALRHIGRTNVAGLTIHQEPSHERTSYPLSISIVPGESLTFKFRHIDSAYSTAQMTRLGDAWRTLLESIRPESRIRDLFFVSESARRELASFQAADVETPSNRTIAELFDQQAAAHPERLALVTEDAEFSYRGLAARVETLSNRIINTVALREDESIVLCLEPGAALIIGMLAILKAGGAYVPIDPSAPMGRKRNIFNQTGARIAIAETDADIPARAIIIDPMTTSAAGERPANVPVAGLAYVLFTSGSTGEPKGVMVEQHSVVNLVHAGIAPIWRPLGSALRIALIAPPTFDASVQQIFGALLMGNTLCVPSARTKRDSGRLLDWLEKNAIDVCDGTPSRFSLLMEAGLCERPYMPVRCWMLGGEGLSTAMLRDYWSTSRFRDVIVANLYGPTECCVDVSYDLYTAGQADGTNTAPIGKPFGNVRVLVLDSNLRELPILFEGEICVAGAAVGRGYLGDSELAHERFVSNPAIPGSRLYRTGDRGRWLPDGRLEWLGRTDGQVKLRGYRIELGEIEQALRMHPLVAQSAADIVRTPAGCELAAWFTASEDIQPAELRKWMLTMLPDYMVPAYLMPIEALPLTANGKVDRTRLPFPHAAPELQEREPNPTERVIRDVWEGVLGRSPIGLNVDFFASGGHSLKAMQVVTRLRRDLGVTVGLDEFFADPTIEGVAALLATRDTRRFLNIEVVPQASDYPASHAQKRLWFLDQLESSAAYNMPVLIAIRGDLDAVALQDTFRDLLARHEILRTRLELRSGELRQVVAAEAAGDFVTIDLRSESDSGARVLDLALAESLLPFDLATQFLIRVRLFPVAEWSSFLFINVHHAAADGLSIDVLANDFFQAYAARRRGLAPDWQALRIQYRDYAAWSNRQMAGPAAESHRRYWLGKLSGEIPVLNLNTRPRPVQLSFRGGRIRFSLNEIQLTAIRTFAALEKISLFAVLVAGVKALVHRYSGDEDIIVGTAVSGRDHADLEPQVGCYINTLALRTAVRSSDSFGALVKSVSRTIKDALEHAAYPFDLLVDQLPLVRDVSRNPLFDVLVLLQPAGNGLNSLPDLHLDRIEFDRGVSKFDLTFDFAEQSDGSLRGTLEFSSDLFDRPFVERLASHFTALLCRAIESPITPLGKLQFLSEAERRQLIEDLSGAVAAQQTAAYESVSVVLQQYAAEFGERPAISFAGRQINFAVLERTTASLARYLLKCGVQRGDVVGVSLPRSEWLPIAEFAILRVGAVFLPFTESIPVERARLMAADSGMRALIAASIPVWATGILVIDPRSEWGDDSPLPHVRSEDAAYLIYTSGSTGTPKGVLIAHRSLLAFAKNLATNFGFRDGEKIYASTAATFDISILELICAPLNRLTVEVATDLALEDPEHMAREIEHCGATLLQFTPSRLTQLLSEAGGKCLESVRVLLVGGEPFPASMALQLAGFPHLQVWNVYGPTETCIWSAAELISCEEGAPSIGKALSEESILILSPEHELQPVGAAGEIAIGGSGLAIGYLNDEALTALRFVQWPFGRLYLTGDLGVWTESGRLKFLGRKDRQVKLRGHRIELGEIEHHLYLHPALASAVVVIREGELTAYVVARRPYRWGELIGKLRAHLDRALPEHMIPSSWVALDQVPLTASGKVDYGSLPCPIDTHAGAGWEAPSTAAEWSVAGAFADVLGRAKVGRKENFFDLGGQSLKAMQVVSRLRVLAPGFSLADLFSAQTVQAVAGLLHERSIAALPPVVQVPASDTGYGLSHVQRRLWVLEQIEPDAAAYNMSSAFELEGAIDLTGLESSIRALTSRHEILRTVFALHKGEPKQFIRDALHPRFETIDLRGVPDQPTRLAALMDAAMRAPFDLARGPLFRCMVYRLEDRRFGLSLGLHHLVADAWSVRVLLNDLCELYRRSVLPPLEIQYRDWSSWQNGVVQSGLHESQREYWHGRLAAPIPVLSMPVDFPRPTMQSFRGGERRFTIGSATVTRLREIARESGASLFMTLVAVIKVLLHRYTGNEDIVVGTPVAGREHLAAERLVGPFLNSLALRDTVQGTMTFRGLLNAVRSTVIAALENQAYPFDLLVDELIVERDTSRSAFFDVMVAVGTEDALEFDLDGIVARPMPVAGGVSKFELSYDFTETEGGGIDAVIEYNRDIFLPGRIQRMQKHIETLLDAITRSPDQKLDALSILPDEEKNAVLRSFNGSDATFDREATALDLFEACARSHPQALAVTCQGRLWTYRELENRASVVAVQLNEQHRIGVGDFVAIYALRSDWFLISVLAVAKAGAAFVPLDPNYPPDRTTLLLQASSCRVVLAEPETASLECAVDVLNVAEISAANNSAVLSRRAGPEDLAYVIYTSGSTGIPKGVAVTHLNLANLISHYVRTVPLTINDRSSVLASMAFDTSIAEYWPLLCSGGSIHFPSPEVRESPIALIRWIGETGITVINVPTALGELILRGPLPARLALHTVIVGGEKLRSLPNRSYPFRIVNSYGPTETTVDAAWAWLDREKYCSINPPIGGPVQNARLYVLDARLNPLPIGIAGELYIGGAGVARGYLNEPELTEQKFVLDPFAKDGSRMYATGDRVRWREDGQLEYLERIDCQLKIRGYRIEPGEIEARLLAYPGIRAAVVSTVRQGESSELVAWVVVEENTPRPNRMALRGFVRSALPEFMTPARLAYVDGLPMTPSGKVDRAALPFPRHEADSAARAVLPRTPVEEVIHSAWTAILGPGDFGVEGNFFEFGGHSLKAMQLTVRLMGALEVEISLREIFGAPTIAAQAELVAKKRAVRSPKLQPAPVLPDYPLSHAQRRLWLTAMMEGSSAHYNMPGAYVIDGPVNNVALLRAITTILERHQILRTRFIARQGEPRQVVDPLPEGEIELPRIDLRGAADPEARARELAQMDLRQPFDLANDRLFRCRLLQLSGSRHILLFTLHHIAGDGWSTQVLYEELSALYWAYSNGHEPALPVLRVQYKDYAWWEQEWGFATEEAYWLAKLSGPPELVRLPADSAGFKESDFTGASVATVLPSEVANELRSVALEHQTTLSNVVLTIFFIFLNRLTEQADLSVGMSMANRADRDLETMVGFFVNALVIRASLDERKSFEQLLKEVTEEVAGALKHQRYPLDLLVEKLNPPRRGNRQSLFNVMYAFQAFTDIAVRRSGPATHTLLTDELQTTGTASKFDLTLFVVDRAGPAQDSLQLSFEYSTEIFAPGTAKSWIDTLGRFCAVVAEGTAEPSNA